MTRPPIRVIGRIDLAEQIRAALRASDVEAELYTGGPMSGRASRRTRPVWTWWQ